MTRQIKRRPPAFILVACALLFTLIAPPVVGAAEVTVSAAASLSDAFRDIKRAYEKTAPQQTIWINTGASGALLRQMENGAPVDVFASADRDTMTSAVKARLVSAAAPKVFARNSLVVIVPADAQTTMSKPHDLLAPGIQRIAIGNPATVPAGHYATIALKSASVLDSLHPKFIQAENVRQALAYVSRGEVDAGIVYATDARLLTGKVKVAFRLSSPVAVEYVIAPTTTAKDPAAAAKFIRYVTTPPAQDILARYGFERLQ